jgi:hypothetical protein
MNLSLPEAVIRFKQGFGRLIRHSDDRGAVVVLDARLLKKRYGQLFIDSLPPSLRSFVPLEELCRSIKSFIGRPIVATPPETENFAPHNYALSVKSASTTSASDKPSKGKPGARKKRKPKG